MQELWGNVVENATYVAGILGISALIFLLAAGLERLAQRRARKAAEAEKDGGNGVVAAREGAGSSGARIRRVVVVGMFSAIAGVLMLFEIPMPFAPSFYKLDFSELPVLIGGFAFGPVAGVLIELIKVLVKLMIKGTSTAFVGEFANFAVGCSLILPASVIYSFRKTKRAALIGLLVGTLTMTVFGALFNAVYLLPAFSALFGMPMEAIYGMATAINPLVREGDMFSFVAACVAPLNLIKGTLDSVITLLVYKKLSPILKGR